jgi:hypothetical protein
MPWSVSLADRRQPLVGGLAQCCSEFQRPAACVRAHRLRSGPARLQRRPAAAVRAAHELLAHGPGPGLPRRLHGLRGAAASGGGALDRAMDLPHRCGPPHAVSAPGDPAPARPRRRRRATATPCYPQDCCAACASCACCCTRPRWRTRAGRSWRCSAWAAATASPLCWACTPWPRCASRPSCCPRGCSPSCRTTCTPRGRRWRRWRSCCWRCGPRTTRRSRWGGAGACSARCLPSTCQDPRPCRIGVRVACPCLAR